MFFPEVKSYTWRQALTTAWSRLPYAVKAQLADVRVVEAALPPGRLGDAGQGYVRLAAGAPVPTLDVAIGVAAHELAHIAAGHTRPGPMSEHEADEYARAWGFGPELAARDHWYGR